jgi:hypothetical protein
MDDRMKRSRKQEAEGAKRWGGQVNSGSGNGDKFKSDVRTPDELIEFKGTKAASYKLTYADLAIAYRHALLEDREMVFGIEFFADDLAYYPGIPRRYVVAPEDDYIALKQRIRDLEEENQDLNRHLDSAIREEYEAW